MARMQQRCIEGLPFCWQEKKMLRRIRDHFDATNNISAALAVYTALTEIASDEHSEVFQRRIADIAARAGLSYRSASTILSRFEDLAVIGIGRNKVPGTKENAPSTYVLRMLGNDCRTLCNGSTSDQLPREIEESVEESPELAANGMGNRPAHHSDEWCFEGFTDDVPGFEEPTDDGRADSWRDDYSNDSLEVIDLYNTLAVPRGWRPVNKYSEKLEGVVERLFADQTVEDFRQVIEEAVRDRDNGDEEYNRRLGNKLIRILANQI